MLIPKKQESLKLTFPSWKFKSLKCQYNKKDNQDDHAQASTFRNGKHVIISRNGRYTRERQITLVNQNGGNIIDAIAQRVDGNNAWRTLEKNSRRVEVEVEGRDYLRSAAAISRNH